VTEPSINNDEKIPMSQQSPQSQHSVSAESRAPRTRSRHVGFAFSSSSSTPAIVDQRDEPPGGV
jgi:hypothetical protein